MRYYFNIDSPDGIDADVTGQEFPSMEAAAEHLCDTIRELMTQEGLARSAVVAHSVIEISSADGDSKVLPLADVLEGAARGVKEALH